MADDGGDYVHAGCSFVYDAAALRIKQSKQDSKAGNAAALLPAYAKAF